MTIELHDLERSVKAPLGDINSSVGHLFLRPFSNKDLSVAFPAVKNAQGMTSFKFGWT